MRYRLIIFAFLLVYSNGNLFSQDCPLYNILISNQISVDSFPVIFPDCHNLNGSLTIDGNDITNLDSLYVIDYIDGSLRIQSNLLLEDISGLSNIDSIDGNLSISNNEILNDLEGLENIHYVDNLDISNNDSLERLDGLNVKEINGDLPNDRILVIAGNNSLIDLSALLSLESSSLNALMIRGHDKLVSLDGLDSLTHIEYNLTIDANDSLENFSGLHNIKNVGNNIYLANCHNLESMSDLNSLDSIGGNLVINNNTNLKNFIGFDSLKYIKGDFIVKSDDYLDTLSLNSFEGFVSLDSIGGDFTIENQDSLIDFSGLENLIAINGDLTISMNDRLQSLNGLDSVILSNIESITITDNSSLSDCAVQSICNYFTNSTSNNLVQNNAYGCNDVESIIESCEGYCFLDGITFSNQEALDDFALNNSDCNKIGGDVIISGSDITDISALSNLEMISGKLEIIAVDITNIAFDSLKYAGGRIRIAGCYELETIDTFHQLDSVGGSLSIYSIPNVISFTGFDNLIKIGGTFHFDFAPFTDSITNFPKLKSIGLSMSITGYSVDYEGFPMLDYVGGDLEIAGNEVYSTLCYASLDSVGGDIEINVAVSQLSDFVNLKKIGGTLDIFSNYTLDSLPGFPMLETIGDQLLIMHNDNITKAHDFSSLESVRWIYIYGNDKLAELPGFPSLNFIQGPGLRIQGNHSLNSLIGLESIQELEYLSILDNDSLETLFGLNNSLNITNEIQVSYNDDLTDISVMNEFDFIGLNQFTLVSNDQLGECQYDYICSVINDDDIIVSINDNAGNCQNLTDVEMDCNNNCYEGGISFSSQEEIDNFPILNLDCNDIDGEVIISGSDISNLEPLNQIETINGDLSISNCDLLLDLTGLENLEWINGDLIVNENEALLSIEGIDNIDPNSIQNLVIQNNNYLSMCLIESVCSYILEPVGDLTIENNAEYCNSLDELLVSCDELSPVLIINTQEEIDDFFEDCNFCTSFEGGIIIQGNDISNLDGFENLISVDGFLVIGGVYGNPLLTNINGLSNLDSISSSLYIINNPSLSSFPGIVENSNAMDLSSLTSIGGSLVISYNQTLENLIGIESLESIGGDLVINNNDSLSSIIALENLDYQSIENLYIHDNMNLSLCQAQVICSYISDPTGLTEINNNNEDCNSADEVYAICTVGVEENDRNNEVIIYPNPADNQLFIQSEKEIELIKIYNLQGQVALQTLSKTLLDISSLSSGIYFIEISTDTEIFRKKLVIQ